MKNEMNIKPVAYIRTDFKEKFGIPRQSGRAKSLIGRVVFLPEYRNPDFLRGLDGFSHIWLIFGFSKALRENVSATVRPPRLGGNKRIGVFASRSPFRPNPVGLSSVRLEAIEESKEDGMTLIVSGVDLLDMTPIYDIKPYLAFSDCHNDAVCGYAEQFIEYALEVDFPDELLRKVPETKQKALIECLKDDPRPSYQDEPERIYSMLFAGLDVKFKIEGKKLKVVDVVTI